MSTYTETGREPDAYVCENCDELVRADAAESPLYECGDCGTRYTREGSADGDGNRCPDCNKFGAKIADAGCPECGEGELSPLYRAVAE